MHARERYIVRHGLPWGALAGGIAALVVVRSAWHDRFQGAGIPFASLVALGVVCFVMWAGIVGWIVGAVL